MRNTVSSLIMLSAGMIAVLCCIFMGYTLESTLIVLVTVLIVFMIIGFVAQRIINSMTKEAEERFQREEAKRREEEAAALAALQAAEEAAMQETASKDSIDSFENDSDDSGDNNYSTEMFGSMQE